MSDVHPLQVNPFEADVIAEPRAVSYSVPGLNDEPLHKLLARFESLTQVPLPRPPIRAGKAQLVVSPDAGYGKSHLLGRLFQKLGERATQIYLRPFESAERAWSSILLGTVQELERPGEHGDHGGTQLEAFALGVLVHVAADFMADGGISDYESVKPAVDYLRSHPLQVLGPASPNKVLIKWLRARLDDSRDLVHLGALFRRRGVQLDGREKGWLRVLAGYAFSAHGSFERDAALTWLRGEPLEQEQAQALKIIAADNDVAGDAPARQVNEISLRRLRGLCMLSSYYRPFLFCFDQTESYGRTAELVDALGSCICELADDIPNHLTIVTCNATNWLQELRPRMLPAYQDRFSPPIDLEGIDQKEAKELLAERLREFQLGERIAEFVAPDWLGSHFAMQPRIGVRYLLNRAAERFRMQSGGPTTSAPLRPSVDAVFALEINKVRAKPALQQYSQDCLLWFSEWLVQGFERVNVTRPHHKYFSVRWGWPDRSVHFAFEAGHNNARWRAIANEAMTLTARAGGAARSIVFRTPDLKPIPGPTWVAARHVIDEATSKGLRIVALSIDEVCELHAAREFYSNALQGNVDFTPAEVLEFLKKRFAPWFKRCSQAEPSPPAPKKPLAEPAGGKTEAQANGKISQLTAAQIEIVVSHLRARRLVDINEVLEKLGGEEFKQPLLREVERHPNLKAHAGAQTIVLQWRV
jgi:hypothetical protein